MELFNLAEDPGEMANRAADPSVRSVLDEMRDEILRDWDPEAIEDQAEAQRSLQDYVRAAPSDPSIREGESWRGPRNYGSVNPV